MAIEKWFETDQNKALMAIGARKTIASIGVGGLIWGLINIGFGVVAMANNPINACIILLGLLMLGSGIFALVKPVLVALLMEAIVCVLLTIWNIGVTILNILAGEPGGIYLPIIVIAFTVFLFKQYFRLHPVRELIASLDKSEVKRAQELAKGIMKAKLKESPNIVLASRKSFWGASPSRIQLMEDQAFFTTKKLSHSFLMPKDEMGAAIKDLNAKKLKLIVNHPLEKITYTITKTNVEKIRNWLTAPETNALADEPEADAAGV